ncbi:hypothetical protein BHM03_00026210 [Ensete ventricosum]|nr:hypothetical protein BHM03_00026210 [Ensete ventricosum]
MALRLPAVPNESKPFCLTSLRVGIDAYDSRSMHVDRCTPVEGAYPRASVSIAVGSRSGTHGKKLRARLVIRLAKPAFNPSCGHVTCRHWTTCGFCTYLYPMPTCRAFVSWLFGSCTSELASSYFTCHGSLVTIDGTCIPLTCLMMGARLYRTTPYGLKFLIGTVPVHDDVVCGVLTIVAPGIELAEHFFSGVGLAEHYCLGVGMAEHCCSRARLGWSSTTARELDWPSIAARELY